ncbi:MAG: hypothetical protein PHN45_10780 [Methylococcales bacterium]|nr:hypothetical protein [Methylococcales bacterium]MDD5755221.1 hypothetical protein [Methylococcales bacterium]
MIEKTEKKSRRGFKIYAENPSVEEACFNSKTGKRRISNRTEEELAYITLPDGERLAEAHFYEKVTVDKTQFIKLYIQGVKALQGLSSAGTKVFEFLYCEMQKKISNDKVCLHYNNIDQKELQISERTLHRGITELLEKEFIFESNLPSIYFVNVNYLFNGDRLSFVKEYRLKK